MRLDDLILGLSERMILVEAVELPFTCFADDLSVVVAAIDRLGADGTPLVAVAHSLGGLYLTEAGAGATHHRSAAQLVYIAAVMTSPLPSREQIFLGDAALAHVPES